jgi:hypothetical protein
MADLRFSTDAHRDNGKRFVVHADEKLTAFLELKFAIHDKKSRSQPTLLIVPTARQLAKRRKQRLPRRIYETTKPLAAQFPAQCFHARQSKAQQNDGCTRVRHY